MNTLTRISSPPTLRVNRICALDLNLEDKNLPQNLTKNSKNSIPPTLKVNRICALDLNLEDKNLPPNLHIPSFFDVEQKSRSNYSLRLRPRPRSLFRKFNRSNKLHSITSGIAIRAAISKGGNPSDGTPLSIDRHNESAEDSLRSRSSLLKGCDKKMNMNVIEEKEVFREIRQSAFNSNLKRPVPIRAKMTKVAFVLPPKAFKKAKAFTAPLRSSAFEKK